MSTKNGVCSTSQTKFNKNAKIAIFNSGEILILFIFLRIIAFIDSKYNTIQKSVIERELYSLKLYDHIKKVIPPQKAILDKGDKFSNNKYPIVL